MIYYKAFNKDMTCRAFQYIVGETYSIKEDPVMCEKGFHCCANILNCLEYYSVHNSRFCEVEIGPISITMKGKTVTNQITIVRELNGEELESMLSGFALFSDDSLRWFCKGKLHRENDLPAVIRTNCDSEWWSNGLLHRRGDKPAIDYSLKQEWYKNGKRHRENDLPAVIIKHYVHEWWYNGKQHRENDLPAVIYADGGLAWWYNGKRHRKNNLPALIRTNSDKEYWENGKLIK